MNIRVVFYKLEHIITISDVLTHTRSDSLSDVTIPDRTTAPSAIKALLLDGKLEAEYL